MSVNTIVRSVRAAIGRIADSFVEIDKDEPQECSFCGARARAGQRYCDEHEAEFQTRH
jgi:hypothetical protein